MYIYIYVYIYVHKVTELVFSLEEHFFPKSTSADPGACSATGPGKRSKARRASKAQPIDAELILDEATSPQRKKNRKPWDNRRNYRDPGQSDRHVAVFW